MPVDLDQSGFIFQKQNVYLGPTLGWLPLRIKPERNITAGGSYTISPDDGVVAGQYPCGSHFDPARRYQVDERGLWPTRDRFRTHGLDQRPRRLCWVIPHHSQRIPRTE